MKGSWMQWLFYGIAFGVGWFIAQPVLRWVRSLLGG